MIYRDNKEIPSRDTNPCIDCITLPICSNRIKQSDAYSVEMKIEDLSQKCIMLFEYTMYSRKLSNDMTKTLYFIDSSRANIIYEYLKYPYTRRKITSW